ncbi:alkaline phosphatase family protein [Peribacillus saganii]|uniref:Alkaline phosphatase family protein n=2 Tax=Peribacillus saganii TaxID=2303992 RepID=A0A372LT06_9BACI|nr:alkaline phosphatase family protein [Peribacillus saganii]
MSCPDYENSKCRKGNRNCEEKRVDKLENGTKLGKPVLLLVIDTLMDAPLKQAISEGRAPVLKFLVENGQYFPDIIAPFPTMSVNVDTTLLTGTYCDQHRLPGLTWFNQQENRLINYGTHYRELLKLGLGRSIEDVLFNMNENHISHQVVTIHEELQNNSKESASINALIYRGNTEHHLKLPRTLTFLIKIPKNLLAKAPKVFSFGALAKINPSNRYQHFFQKLGINDSSSVQQLTQLIINQRLPNFSIVYFPDLDQSVHKNGRLDVTGIEKADKHLQKIFDLYESWEAALSANIWIAMGDNGQAWVSANKEEALIDLRKMLGSFRIMKEGKGVQVKDQLVLAVNDRMAYIYTLNPNDVAVETVVEILQEDSRIDVIAWKKEQSTAVRSGVRKGELLFRPDGEFMDKYGQSWSLTGDLNVLDIKQSDQGIEYGVYPDALARIHSSLNSHEGDFLIVSAKPGYEFIGEGSPSHVGGAGHGGLHQQDTLVPMIVTGTNTKPPHLRIVDLKGWILSLIE